MNKSKQFLAVLAVSLLCLIVGYSVLVNKAVGWSTYLSDWLKPVVDYKMYLASKQPDRKLVVIGGSNVLFGIESPLLQNMTGYPVVNLGSHGDLDLDYFRFQLDQVVEAGDVVVMPLEFELYIRDIVTKSFAGNMMAWGEDYIRALDLMDFANFVVGVPKEILWRAYQAKERAYKPTKLNSILAHINREASFSKQRKFKGYSYKSLNQDADILVTNPANALVESFALNGESYNLDKKLVSRRFISRFKEIEEIIEERGADLVLTWPVTIRNPKFDMSNAAHQKTIENFVALLEKEQIEIHCEPALFNLDYRLFFDTKYHLNAKGARLRTILLGDCLRSHIEGKDVRDMSDLEVIEKLKPLEQKYVHVKI